LQAIIKIKNSENFNSLPENLKELCLARLMNPDVSLKELGKLLNPVITSSAVHHKMKKIIKISENFI